MISEMFNADQLAAIEMIRELLRLASDEPQATKRLFDLQDAQHLAVKHREEADDRLRVAQLQQDSLDAKQRDLEDQERQLSEHNQALTAEKQAWEAVRQTVAADQKARHAELEAWHDRLEGTEARTRSEAHRVGQLLELNEARATELEMKLKRVQDMVHEVAAA